MTNNLTRLRRAIERVQFVPPSGYLGGGVMPAHRRSPGSNQAVAGSTAIWDASGSRQKKFSGPLPTKPAERSF